MSLSLVEMRLEVGEPLLTNLHRGCREFAPFQVAGASCAYRSLNESSTARISYDYMLILNPETRF